MSTATPDDLAPLQKLLLAVGLPWARFEATGELVESQQLGDLESAILNLASSGATPGSHQTEINGVVNTFEVVVDSSGAFLIYIASENLLAERRINRAKAMESLAGKVVHHYNNILTEFYGHISLLGRIYSGEDELTSRLDRAVDTINRSRHLVERYMFMLREVREPKDTVNVVEVLQDLKTIMDPILSPRIELELGQAIMTPVRVNLEHQLLMQMMVNVAVAAVNDELLISQLGVEMDNNDADVTITLSTDGQSKRVPAETSAVCEFVAKVLQLHGSDFELGDHQGSVAFRFKLRKVIQQDSENTSTSNARSEKSIVLLIDPVHNRSDASKAVLEEMGYSVLDISEGQVANEVFQAQPGIFEYVFIEGSLCDVADEMRLVAKPDSIKVLGSQDCDWPNSTEAWQAFLAPG